MSGSFPNSWEPYGSSQQSQAIAWRRPATRPTIKPTPPRWTSTPRRSFTPSQKPPTPSKTSQQIKPIQAPSSSPTDLLARDLQAVDRENRLLASYNDLHAELRSVSRSVSEDIEKLRNQQQEFEKSQKTSFSALSADISSLHGIVVSARDDVRNRFEGSQARVRDAVNEAIAPVKEIIVREMRDLFSDLHQQNAELLSTLRKAPEVSPVIVTTLNRNVLTIVQQIEHMLVQRFLPLIERMDRPSRELDIEQIARKINDAVINLGQSMQLQALPYPISLPGLPRTELPSTGLRLRLRPPVIPETRQEPDAPTSTLQSKGNTIATSAVPVGTAASAIETLNENVATSNEATKLSRDKFGRFLKKNLGVAQGRTQGKRQRRGRGRNGRVSGGRVGRPKREPRTVLPSRAKASIPVARRARGKKSSSGLESLTRENGFSIQQHSTNESNEGSRAEDDIPIGRWGERADLPSQIDLYGMEEEANGSGQATEGNEVIDLVSSSESETEAYDSEGWSPRSDRTESGRKRRTYARKGRVIPKRRQRN